MVEISYIQRRLQVGVRI